MLKRKKHWRDRMYLYLQFSVDAKASCIFAIVFLLKASLMFLSFLKQLNYNMCTLTSNFDSNLTTILNLVSVDLKSKLPFLDF